MYPESFPTVWFLLLLNWFRIVQWRPFYHRHEPNPLLYYIIKLLCLSMTSQQSVNESMRWDSMCTHCDDVTHTPGLEAELCLLSIVVFRDVGKCSGRKWVRNSGLCCFSSSKLELHIWTEFQQWRLTDVFQEEEEEWSDELEVFSSSDDSKCWHLYVW